MGLTWVVQGRFPVTLSGLMDLEEHRRNWGTFLFAVLQAYLQKAKVFTEGPQALRTVVGPGTYLGPHQYLMNGGMKKSRA